MILAYVESHFRESCGQIKLTHVIGDVVFANAHVGEIQATYMQVLHAVGSGDEVVVDNLFRIVLLLVEDKIAYFLEMGQRIFAVVVVRTARPESLFIELKFIAFGSAIYHSS